MHFPIWAAFGLLSAVFSSTQMALQERFRAAPLPVAFWIKIASALVMLPFVVAHGLPSKPFYYLLLAGHSLLWVISDVIFYRSINDSGAAVVARIIPIATIVSFFLWFAFDWNLARTYIAQPLHSGTIVAVFCLLGFFAWKLKSCKVTVHALRTTWFVLFAAVVGSVTGKYITLQADPSQGVYAFGFIEALMMIVMWLIYYTIKRPVPLNVMFGWNSVKAGMIIGGVAAFAVTTAVQSMYLVDNPAYVSAVRYMDSVLLIGLDRLLRRPSKGRVWAGLGIVGCAVALMILKASR